MLGVYNKVALGLVVSAAMAWLTGMFPPVRDLMFKVAADGRLAGMTPVGWIVAFAPMAIILFTSFGRGGQTPRGAAIAYWSIVVLMGASMGVLALLYTGAALAQTFLITAAAFAGLSAFGYVTKRDLSGMGSFLIVGLIGEHVPEPADDELHHQHSGRLHLRGPDRLRYPAAEADVL
jgi:FtsH-binding integral membrane protein